MLQNYTKSPRRNLSLPLPMMHQQRCACPPQSCHPYRMDSAQLQVDCRRSRQQGLRAHVVQSVSAPQPGSFRRPSALLHDSLQQSEVLHVSLQLCVSSHCFLRLFVVSSKNWSLSESTKLLLCRQRIDAESSLQAEHRWIRRVCHLDSYFPKMPNR